MNTELIQTVLEVVTSLMFPILLPLMIAFMATIFSENIIALIQEAVAKNAGRRFR